VESNLNLYRREVASKIMKDTVPLFVNFSSRLFKISAAKNRKEKNIIKDKEYNKRQFRFPSFVSWKQLSRPYFCSQSFYVLSRGKRHFVGIFVTNARWVHSRWILWLYLVEHWCDNKTFNGLSSKVRRTLSREKSCFSKLNENYRKDKS